MSVAKQKNKQVKKWIIISVLAVVASYFILLVSSVGNGIAYYPIAYLHCGKRPVIANNFATSNTYYKSNDSGYGPNILTHPDDYYCTEQEARAAGFQRSLTK